MRQGTSISSRRWLAAAVLAGLSRRRVMVVFAQQKRSTLAALTRRRILGGLMLSLGLTALFGGRSQAAPGTSQGSGRETRRESDSDCVIVNGWILRRSDLDLMR